MEPQVAAAVAGWRRADERLYPVVMVDPERYTRIVSVVRATADRLAEHESVEELVQARQRGHELVALSCAAAGVAVETLGDVDMVADAAFGLRHREVEKARRRRRSAARIAAARERGDPWVTLDESGHHDQPGVAPYQRIDMRLGDGSAIRAAVDVDPNSYRPVYSIEHLRLDPETGVIAEPAAADDAVTYDDPARWRSAIARWCTDAAPSTGGP